MARRGLPAAKNETATESNYLAMFGERIRVLRTRRGMTRKILAKDSGVSERYLALLEAGKGNVSVLLLRQLARALDVPVELLAADGPEPPLEFQHAMALLRQLPPSKLAQAHRVLTDAFGASARSDRNQRIALIGLRGAGKSTLGAALAKRLDYTFVELDKEIEKAAKAPLGEVFDLYGQAGFRRLERQRLEQVTASRTKVVVSTGGGIVSDPMTFEMLLTGCFTVWLKAAPVEHMERVIAQGDMRPMADNRESMSDLRRILKTRDGLYRKADTVVDTSGRTVAQSLKDLLTAVP